MSIGAAPGARSAQAAPVVLRDLLIELGDLKRVRSAGRSGSIAERLFARGWSALVGGVPPETVALHVTATALAAARLCDLDAAFLHALALSEAEAAAVLMRGFDAVTEAVEPTLRSRLAAHILVPGELPADEVPAFVGLLAHQPRAGVTCPGRPRILLEPPENHAEHCLIVAVYGVLLSPHYGADPTAVFLAALAHHLHNALMPDAGFTGEMLLGAHLETVMARCNERALAELAEPLRGRIVAACAILPDAETPEGRAFHAADAIDRVLQIAQHLKAASLTMDMVLHEMQLVHAGPVKGFHDRVLTAMGLA